MREHEGWDRLVFLDVTPKKKASLTKICHGTQYTPREGGGVQKHPDSLAVEENETLYPAEEYTILYTVQCTYISTIFICISVLI